MFWRACSAGERRGVTTRHSRGWGLAAGALAIFAPRAALAQDANTNLLGQPLVLVVVLAFAALAPFLFMSLTAFVKISTVLQIARGAIGTQNIPSNTVIMALAGALTVIAMAPVGTRVVERVEPLLAESSHWQVSRYNDCF